MKCIVCLLVTITVIIVDTPGQKFQDNSEKYLVQLVTTKDNLSYSCFGIYVADSYILSAAHCVQDAEKIGILFDIKKAPEYTIVATAEKKDVIIHEEFAKKLSCYENDIALIKLNSTTIKQIKKSSQKTILSFNQCPSEDAFDKDRAYVQSFNLDESKFQQKSVTKEICDRLIVADNDKSTFCTDNDNENIGEGDSGAPLICNELPVGLVSGQFKLCRKEDQTHCSGSDVSKQQMVYMSLPYYYMSWIHKKISELTCEDDDNLNSSSVLAYEPIFYALFLVIIAVGMYFRTPRIIFNLLHFIEI